MAQTTSRTMRAERFYADTKSVVLEDVPIPEPGPGEVLVKVAFCGICHSDVSLINGTFPAQRPVVTQGHEASGTIARLGPGVTGWSEGDRVVVAAGRPCGDCPNCRRGDFGNCLRTQLMAFAYDGAWAEYTVALAAGLTRVPDNVPLEQAAILADAVSTPYGAVVRTGKVGIGESVGVWGVGGVGTHIVQLARLVGAAPIIAVDINPQVRERSLELGADHAFDSRDPELGDRIGEVTAYALDNLQQRGTLFVQPGDDVYEGMVIGECARDEEMVVNAVRAKEKTNIRTHSHDDGVKLAAPKIHSLESAIEWIADDELVEVTPKSVRIRKRHLGLEDRRRAAKGQR